MPAEYASHGYAGYGRELIEKTLPYQLRAKTSFVLGENGLRCAIHLPISERQY
ncbi:hypothetical protein FHX16_004059 [Rhizobium sp. BK661]|nr:hypothetical protein [Rhizobium sp. BK661]